MYAACRRRGTEQQVEMSRLHDQTTQLQADLAASHAAELALQQHHTATQAAAAAELAKVEQEHKAAVAVLHQVRCLCSLSLILILRCRRKAGGEMLLVGSRGK